MASNKLAYRKEIQNLFSSWRHAVAALRTASYQLGPSLGIAVTDVLLLWDAARTYPEHTAGMPS